MNGDVPKSRENGLLSCPCARACGAQKPSLPCTRVPPLYTRVPPPCTRAPSLPHAATVLEFSRCARRLAGIRPLCMGFHAQGAPPPCTRAGSLHDSAMALEYGRCARLRLCVFPAPRHNGYSLVTARDGLRWRARASLRRRSRARLLRACRSPDAKP